MTPKSTQNSDVIKGKSRCTQCQFRLCCGRLADVTRLTCSRSEHYVLWTMALGEYSIVVVLLSVTGSGAANRSRLRHSHPGGAISGVMTWGQTPSRQNKYTQPHNIAQPAWAPQLLKGGGQLLTIQRSQDRAWTWMSMVKEAEFKSVVCTSARRKIMVCFHCLRHGRTTRMRILRWINGERWELVMSQM